MPRRCSSSELELVDDELRVAFVTQLDSGGSPVDAVPQRAAPPRARAGRGDRRGHRARFGRSADRRAAIAVAAARRPAARGRRARASRSPSSSTRSRPRTPTSASSPRSTSVERSSTCDSRGDRRHVQPGGIRARLESKAPWLPSETSLTVSPRPSRTSARKGKLTAGRCRRHRPRDPSRPARRRRLARGRQGVHRTCASARSATRSTRR